MCKREKECELACVRLETKERNKHKEIDGLSERERDFHFSVKRKKDIRKCGLKRERKSYYSQLVCFFV